jgi:hypothetical protein
MITTALELPSFALAASQRAARAAGSRGAAMITTALELPFLALAASQRAARARVVAVEQQ